MDDVLDVGFYHIGGSFTGGVWLRAKGSPPWLTRLRKEFIGKAVMHFRELEENRNDQTSCI